jgi:hypothetical protein
LAQHPLDMAAPMAGFHLVVCADPAPTGIMTMRRYRCLSLELRRIEVTRLRLHDVGSQVEHLLREL